MFVKSEVNSNKRRVVSVAAGPSNVNDGVKCIKRRRRQPALPPVATDANGEATERSPASNTIKRSSRFRGVSRHRWTGRFEAHLWDKGSWNATQRKKGKQVYLGAYDEEESAARAYDLAALKYWGPTTFTNFPVNDYAKEMEIMQNMTKEEYLASLRRKSSGFSRGVSKYRGVARHHHNGRWEARIGRVFGSKYLYLGTYSTQEEAAHAYDIAAIEYRGINAITNFDLSTYIRWLRPGSTIAMNPTSKLQPNTGQLQTIQPPGNLFATKYSNSETLENRSPFPRDELLLNCKQECSLHQIPGCKSSPTALSLLLRSSMFHELVEKNSNTPEDEFDGEDVKDQQLQLGGGKVYNGIIYGGIADGPYVCASSADNVDKDDIEDSASYYMTGMREPFGML